jgi:hypothetical protein
MKPAKVLSLVVLLNSLAGARALSLKETTDWIHDFTGKHGTIVYVLYQGEYVESDHDAFNGCELTVTTITDGKVVARAQFNLRDMEPEAAASDQ